MIAGVHVVGQTFIPDSRGVVYHYCKRGDDHWPETPGEVYFSECFPDAVKAWHRHKRMTLRYFCVQGVALLGLIDDRQNSPTYGEQMRITMGPKTSTDHVMVVIPPLVWNGFRVHPEALPDRHVLMANFTDLPHDPDEIERVEPDFFKDQGWQWGSYEVGW